MTGDMDEATGLLARDPEDHASHQDPLGSGVDYSLLFRESPEVLLVLRPDAPRFTMVAATDARFRVTHTTSATLGRGLFEIFPDNPADPDANGTRNLRASLERVLQTRRPDTMPVQKYDIRTASGEFEARYWSPKNIPLLSPEGEVLYIMHRVEDVTELVRASEQGEALRGRTQAMECEVIRRSQELEVALRSLRETNVRLSELDSAKTVFFDTISQEFRTPLALILGTLEEELAVANKALPAQSRMQLRVAHRNSLRLLKLVNTLLDYSRIETGRMQAHYQPTDLARLTTELACHFDSAARQGGLTLSVDCPALPEPVYVDRAMWEKIVLNLLSNAFKHTLRGGITVRLQPLADGVRLDVEDTGAGIAAAELPQLFERFHRPQASAARSHEGTGLGLALVQELVRLHSGSITVDSELGRGSRFTVTLKSGTAHLPADHVGTRSETFAPGRFSAPYIEEALHWTSAPPTTAGESDVVDPGTAPAWKPPRARILCVDDNPDMLAFVVRLLKRSFDVTEARDGQEALESALAAPPDLVLSDVMMPRLDGYGLLRALRADSRTRRLPIILLSARAGENSTVAGLDSGADDYLVKPFAARELLSRVRTHVELAWQRRAWESQLEQQVGKRTSELEARIRRLELLSRITRGMTDEQDPGRSLEVATRAIEEALPADACWIAPPGASADEAAGAAQLPRELADRGLQALVSVPLRVQDEVLGELLVGRRAAEGFSSAEREFLRQLGEHVAIAARQARLQAAHDELHLMQQAAPRPQSPDEAPIQSEAAAEPAA